MPERLNTLYDHVPIQPYGTYTIILNVVAITALQLTQGTSIDITETDYMYEECHFRCALSL